VSSTKRWPPRRLSHSEQDELALLVQGGALGADTLWYEVAPLMVLGTQRWGRSLEPDDALSVTKASFMRALESFNSDRGHFLGLCCTISRRDLISAARNNARQNGYFANGESTVSLSAMEDENLLPVVQPVLPMSSAADLLTLALERLP
jgi:hypothetical protein